MLFLGLLANFLDAGSHLSGSDGVRQGGKIRAVDDFSEFLVNMSVTSTEKLALYGIDEVVNTARAFMCSSFLHVSSDGSYAVDWNKDASKGPWLSLKGRPLDLKAAYTQLARHLCCENPTPVNQQTLYAKEPAKTFQTPQTLARRGQSQQVQTSQVLRGKHKTFTAQKASFSPTTRTKVS